jgi:hypothetical protein
VAENSRTEKLLTGVLIGLSVAGLLAYIFKKLAGGDKPIIMTGGSLNIWSQGFRLLHGGYEQSEHRYVQQGHDSRTRISMVVLKWNGSRPTRYEGYDQVEIAFGASKEPPVRLRDGDIFIRSSSRDEPLKYEKTGDVEDPDGGWVSAHRHTMGEPGERIEWIRLSRGHESSTITWLTDPPTIKIHYV